MKLDTQKLEGSIWREVEHDRRVGVGVGRDGTDFGGLYPKSLHIPLHGSLGGSCSERHGGGRGTPT